MLFSVGERPGYECKFERIFQKKSEVKTMFYSKFSKIFQKLKIFDLDLFPEFLEKQLNHWLFLFFWRTRSAFENMSAFYPKIWKFLQRTLFACLRRYRLVFKVSEITFKMAKIIHSDQQCSNLKTVEASNKDNGSKREVTWGTITKWTNKRTKKFTYWQKIKSINVFKIICCF